MKESRPKAIALMSGGLDSTLAARLIHEQGIEVIGLHLSSPFGCETDLESAARAAKVSHLIIREKGEAYIELLKQPKYGYGKNMNPCIDCRIFMFQLTESVMEEHGAAFIVTGEVLGQRPMSQRRDAMNVIDRESEFKGRILRPLSAKLFPESVAEQKGWVDREKLYGISGRSRKIQLALAERLGIDVFEAPGGGCLLTDVQFSRKLKDFFGHDDGVNQMAKSQLLKYGRHFRVSEALKVIVGRNEKENEVLEKGWRAAGGTFFNPDNFSGPAAIAFGEMEPDQRQLIGEILVRYSKVEPEQEKRVVFATQASGGLLIVDKAFPQERLEAMRI